MAASGGMATSPPPLQRHDTQVEAENGIIDVD
jgi:hypothetical protein